jgi:hypothetical protein
MWLETPEESVEKIKKIIIYNSGDVPAKKKYWRVRQFCLFPIHPNGCSST